MSHRPYQDDADFAALLAFLSQVNLADPAAGYLHPGDLTWWMRQNNQFVPQDSLELFHDTRGRLEGFVFNNPPEWATIQAAPDVSDTVLDEMLNVAEAKARAAGKPLTVAADAGDQPLTRALERAGFARTPDQMLCFRYDPATQGVPEITLPEGYSFQSVTDDPALMEKRVELHRTVWHPSKVTLDAYEHLRAAPSYRADLDTVLVAPDGEVVAYAQGWYDPMTRNGIQEPVGTHPDHRGQGLGRLIVREVTRRLMALGAEQISIYTFETNPVATALYRSAGFKQAGEVVDWQRPAGQ